MSFWPLNGQVMENCTKEDMTPEDLSKPCKLLTKELDFNKVLSQKLGTKRYKAKYLLMDINDFSNSLGSPVEIIIKECQKIKQNWVKIIQNCETH